MRAKHISRLQVAKLETWTVPVALSLKLVRFAEAPRPDIQSALRAWARWLDGLRRVFQRR